MHRQSKASPGQLHCSHSGFVIVGPEEHNPGVADIDTRIARATHGRCSFPANLFSPTPMKTLRFHSCLLRVLLFSSLLVLDAAAQTSLQLTQLQLRYRVAKRATKLDDAKAAELKTIEASAMAAYGRGESGLVFRDLQRGLALLAGRAWTPDLAFATSLALEPAAVVCDAGKPLTVHLRQLYPASRDGAGKLTAHASLGRGGAAPNGKAQGGSARTLGTFPGVGGDLSKAPFSFPVSLGAVEAVAYQLTVEVRDGDRLVQRLSAPLFPVRDLDVKQVDTEARLAKVAGFEPVKTSIRYPFDFARVLNRGMLDPGPYDFTAGLARGETLLRAIEAGTDPFPAERGALFRHYFFAEAGEIMPYRVVVPKSYNGLKAMPLIVVLHGLGGTENTFMQQGNGALPRLAEERGFLVATPLGYRRNGGYGRPGGGPLGPLDPESARMVRLSEEDVLNVLKEVRANYRVDPDRIYLMGHSMGGGGTWIIGSRHAEIWAGLAPIAGGSASPSLLPLANLKQHHLPVYVVHGDADRTAPVETSRVMVAELKKLGVECEYHEIPGGTHGDVVGPAIPKIVEFFSQHARQRH